MLQPTQPESDKIIHDLGDPQITLRDVAELHNTTLQALTAWMAKPDITKRIENLRSACLTRTRLLAANYLAITVETLHNQLRNFNYEECHAYDNPRDPQARERRRRARDSARKAARLLHQIATPSRREGAGGGFVHRPINRSRTSAQIPSPRPPLTEFTRRGGPTPRSLGSSAAPKGHAPLDLHELRAQHVRARSEVREYARDARAAQQPKNDSLAALRARYAAPSHVHRAKPESPHCQHPELNSEHTSVSAPSSPAHPPNSAVHPP